MTGIPPKTHCEGEMRHKPCPKRDGCIKYLNHLSARTYNTAISRAEYVNAKLCADDDFIMFEDGEDD